MEYHQSEPQLFDDQLLADFMDNFYGYGNYQAKYWFMGMEEGGGGSFTDITNRLQAWGKRGRCELEDVAAYHEEIGVTQCFGKHPKLQRTWSKLIRILLSAEGAPPTTEQVREYQRSSLGRSGGNTCLLELLPLPSPSTGHWLYGQHSRLPYLTDRDTYQQTWLARRKAHLKHRIQAYQPQVVIFYSFSYRGHWQEIVGHDFVSVLEGQVYWHRQGNSLFVVTKHPTAWGVTNHDFHQVGAMIAEELAKD